MWDPPDQSEHMAELLPSAHVERSGSLSGMQAASQPASQPASQAAAWWPAEVVTCILNHATWLQPILMPRLATSATRELNTCKPSAVVDVHAMVPLPSLPRPVVDVHGWFPVCLLPMYKPTKVRHMENTGACYGAPALPPQACEVLPQEMATTCKDMVTNYADLVGCVEHQATLLLAFWVDP
jgi:hypothetical protein